MNRSAVFHYRLIADHGRPSEEFTAADDVAAISHARQAASEAWTAKTVGFRLERQEDLGWATVSGWLPRRVRDYPGGLDVVVPPER
jgi:hypothetical protein